MRKLIFIKVVVVFFALLLFTKAGMATAVYLDKNSSETACFVKSSDNLNQKGIVEPVLQLQSPASSGRILNFIENNLKAPERSTFAQEETKYTLLLKLSPYKLIQRYFDLPFQLRFYYLISYLMFMNIEHGSIMPDLFYLNNGKNGIK